MVETTWRDEVASPARSGGKRVADIVGAILVLTFFLPITIVMITAIRLSRRGPVFAREETIGLGGRAFRRWRLHRPVERESVFDKVLWRAGLTDLPSALNVIAGDMSLIGPRPHSPERCAYLRRGHADYMRRFEARPGMIWPGAAEPGTPLGAELDYVRAWSALRDLREAGVFAVNTLLREPHDSD